MRYKIYEWLYYTWHSFWYHLIYKSERIGNYRKTINRFTGEHKVYKVHPLARLGVNFSQEQVNFINALLKDERTLEAQELILQDIPQETISKLLIDAGPDQDKAVNEGIQTAIKVLEELQEKYK